MEFFLAQVVVIERVIDGDTVVLSEPLHDVTKVRLPDIDTPETRSAHCNREKLLGYEAKGYARALLEGKTVQIHTSGKKGRYGRLIARITIDSKDYSQIMINKGYAVRYTKEWSSTPKNKRWCRGRDLRLFDK